MGKDTSELAALLNKLGDDGWELVTMLAKGTATRAQIRFKALITTGDRILDVRVAACAKAEGTLSETAWLLAPTHPWLG